MCGSIFFGFLFGVIAFKALRRLAWARHHGFSGGCGHHGGGPGCRGGHGIHGWGGGFGGFRGPGAGPYRRSFYRWGTRWNQGGGFYPGDETDGAGYAAPAAPAPAPTTGKNAEELIKGMDLNQRQRAEAQPVLALLKAQLGPSGAALEAALATVAAEQFDPDKVRAALHLDHAPPALAHDILDGLEHFHTILIPEQRESLRDALKITPAAGAPGTPSV